MSALLNEFMEEHFGSMTLVPYRWNCGIRFEIAIPWADHEEPCNLRQIRDRSIGIFEFVFDDSDDIFFVTDIHCDAGDTRLQRRPARVYPKYVKNKKRIRTLRHQVLPNLFGEDGEGQEENNEVTHRFVLLCRKKRPALHPASDGNQPRGFPASYANLKTLPPQRHRHLFHQQDEKNDLPSL
ncbi:hypothetical protein L3476_16780 [Paenibacillus thiaminolyticus]|uniref:DUF3885 domain-containing protein n=1 Tax=Paenibacillus thiaminolyticus TaxID=49283 RepID=UPI002350AF3C|nr:hypothetical protein [Paenibacillus thiaminolyticus]WCR25025.1 hypothetical protein L3476_16780 [Paenibacillus thiaminolyticus]